MFGSDHSEILMRLRDAWSKTDLDFSFKSRIVVYIRLVVKVYQKVLAQAGVSFTKWATEYEKSAMWGC